MELVNLRRLRWGVRAVLALGIAASVTANVLHADDDPISKCIAAWPPLALLLTVELISRIPVTKTWVAVARLMATTAIAGIAAWVSYWHMVGVAEKYGESDYASQYLLPLSVDGLIVVASICLVELGARLAKPKPAPAPAAEPISPLVRAWLTERESEAAMPTPVAEQPKPELPKQPEPPTFPVPEPQGPPVIVEPGKPAEPAPRSTRERRRDGAAAARRPDRAEPKSERIGVIDGREVPVPQGATVVDNQIIDGERLREVARHRYIASIATGTPLSQRGLANSFTPPMSQPWAKDRIAEVVAGGTTGASEQDDPEPALVS